ncbi:hypothetical protein [Luteibacter sp. ME-Dv--P-043b]|uniref:hypothetical protein n=1 Tax=unclassified Luteibacter TaxID=2620188 RepID=UPI002552C869|nr:hypothetical protein [Luteibacter sp. ME-Dv--P-043b]
MVVLRELVERLVWRVTLQRRLGEVFALPGGVSLASRAAPWISEGAWWGRHDAATEASALFAALHRDDIHEAAFRAHRLQRASRRRGLADVAVHAEALEIALVSHDACGAVAVCHASVHLVRSLTGQGILLTSQP